VSRERTSCEPARRAARACADTGRRARAQLTTSSIPTREPRAAGCVGPPGGGARRRHKVVQGHRRDAHRARRRTQRRGRERPARKTHLEREASAYARGGAARSTRRRESARGEALGRQACRKKERCGEQQAGRAHCRGVLGWQRRVQRLCCPGAGSVRSLALGVGALSVDLPLLCPCCSCPASTGLVSVPKKKQRPRTLENQRKAVSHCGTARCSDRGARLRRDGGGRGSAGGLDVPQGPRHQLYVLLSRGDGRVAMGKAPAGRRAQARGAVGRADAGAAGAFARAPPPQRIAHAQAFARPARPRERARAPRCATPPARFRA
jgi:hypothetical protein